MLNSELLTKMLKFILILTSATAVALAQGEDLPECVVTQKTSICVNNTLDYSFLLRGRYDDIDCTTAEAIDNVVSEGRLALVELEKMCSTMPPADQGRMAPPLQYTYHIDTVTCMSDGLLEVVFKDWLEVEQFKDSHALTDCRDTFTTQTKNVRGCVESSNDPYCIKGLLDYTAFDADMRPDCTAFEVRGDVATLGLEGMIMWEEDCMENYILELQYIND